MTTCQPAPPLSGKGNMTGFSSEFAMSALCPLMLRVANHRQRSASPRSHLDNLDSGLADQLKRDEDHTRAAPKIPTTAALVPRMAKWTGMNFNIDGAPIVGKMPGA